MFGLALSDDDTQSDSADAPQRKIKRTGAATSSGGKRAATGVAPKPAGGHKKGSAEGKAPGDGRASGEEDEDDGDGAKIGRPVMDIIAHSKLMMNQFEKADDRTLYFSSRSDVQRRSLARWISKAAQKAAGGDAQFEYARKVFQVIDQCIGMHRKWVQRKDLEKAAECSHIMNHVVAGCRRHVCRMWFVLRLPCILCRARRVG
jgi:hypothetical protein